CAVYRVMLVLLVTLSPFHLVTLPASQAAENLIDSPMYKLPDLPEPKTELIFSEKAKALWLKALKLPTVEMRSRAAQTIALAHRRGMKGLEDAIDPLLALIDNATEHPAVRLEAVKALIELDVRRAAGNLHNVAQTGSSELREVIEAVLA